MRERRTPEQLSVTELERLLYEKKRAERHRRLQRLKAAGRLVEVAGRPPANASPPPLHQPAIKAGGVMRHYTLITEEETAVPPPPPATTPSWRQHLNRFL
ncbi:MAG: hypothetical protein D6706_17750, partial [Chloroflexi bacterium]